MEERLRIVMKINHCADEGWGDELDFYYKSYIDKFVENLDDNIDMPEKHNEEVIAYIKDEYGQETYETLKRHGISPPVCVPSRPFDSRIACGLLGVAEMAEMAENKKLEDKVIRYALVYLKANFEEEDAEDLEIDDMVLDGMLSRMIKKREE